MCDEYDEERLRAFWRALAAANLSTWLEEPDAIPVRDLGTPVSGSARKARSLLR